jgi:hypothetical protein
MTLSAEQKKFYEQTLAVTKKEISDLEANIQDELAKVKERRARDASGPSDVRRRVRVWRSTTWKRRSAA